MPLVDTEFTDSDKGEYLLIVYIVWGQLIDYDLQAPWAQFMRGRLPICDVIGESAQTSG